MSRLVRTLARSAIVFIATLSAAIAPARAAERSTDSSYEQVREALDHCVLDAARQAPVENLLLERDGARVLLARGTLILSQPIEGSAPFAVFVGEGTAELTPPIAIEAAQLERMTGTPRLERAISALVCFHGARLPEEFASLSFQAAPLPVAAPDLLHDFLGFLRDPDTELWDERTMATLLNPERPSGLLLELNRSGELPLFYQLDPGRFEPNSFWRGVRSGIQSAHDRELLSRFAPAARYVDGRPLDREERSILSARDYAIDLRVGQNLDLRGRARFTLEASDGPWRWLPLELGEDWEVDSLRWSDGTGGRVFKQRDDRTVWIEHEGGLPAGQKAELSIVYHGDPLEHVGDLIHVDALQAWYPAALGFEPTHFDLTFHTPKGITLTALGEEVEHEAEGSGVRQRFQSSTPARRAHFELGYFESVPIRDPRIPEVTVLWSKHADAGLSSALADSGFAVGKSMERQVAADVANSLLLFASYWGPSPAKHLVAVEAPRNFGIAYPGLVCLDPTTFVLSDRYRRNELFRAHEVAHQWWGTSLLTASYHDRWLSEGFAEYASLRYVQEGLGDNESFLRILGDWRKDILKNRRYVAGEGQKAAPIWFGLRTEGRRTEGDSELILYRKSAWVLHMLQSMFLDLKARNEQPFVDLLSDFYHRYAGRTASTEDFARVAEEHFGAPLGWFFEQWIYGADTPVYEVAHQFTRAEDGTYLTHVRVKQSGVPPTFRAYPILKLELPEGRFMRLRAHITGEVVEFDLPPVPDKPERLVFGDLESILGEVKEVKY